MKRLPFILLLFLIISSCSKYEDNEGITFKSKEKRLARSWTSETVEINGQPVSRYLEYDYEFFGSGNFEGELRDLTADSIITFSGSWSFSDDKKTLFVSNDSGYTEKWSILRLEAEHLWIEVEFPSQGVIIYVEFREN